jgi:hypothetical protein
MEVPPPPPLAPKPKQTLQVKTAKVQPIGPPPDPPLDLNQKLFSRDCKVYGFDSTTNEWVSVPLDETKSNQNSTSPKKLIFATWNMDGRKDFRKERTKAILSNLKKLSPLPDFIALQEVKYDSQVSKLLPSFW